MTHWMTSMRAVMAGALWPWTGLQAEPSDLQASTHPIGLRSQVTARGRTVYYKDQLVYEAGSDEEAIAFRDRCIDDYF